MGLAPCGEHDHRAPLTKETGHGQGKAFHQGKAQAQEGKAGHPQEVTGFNFLV
jgi:hypothetical protein